MALADFVLDESVVDMLRNSARFTNAPDVARAHAHAFTANQEGSRPRPYDVDESMR